MERGSKAITAVPLARTSVEAGVELRPLYGLDMGVRGLPPGMLVGEAISGSFMLVNIVRTQGARFVKRTFMPLLRCTAPATRRASSRWGRTRWTCS